MIIIIDYGAGNLHSVQNALDYLGVENEISDNPIDLYKADKLILPGVGAFPDAMRALNAKGLADVIKEQALAKPFLGICLGMQMLFDKGTEFEETEGLGLIKGTVGLMAPENLAIPHMGWNALEKNAECALSGGFEEGEYVYFVHSYMAVCDGGNVAAYCDYGGKVPALVFNGNVCGCQYKNKKSGSAGLKILERFCGL
jgi:glutamine amidotransferase